MKIDHKESYSDFGNQFTVDDKIDDYWGSKEMFLDVIFPFDPSVLKKKDVMEVGSGSGRILKNLPEELPTVSWIFSVKTTQKMWRLLTEALLASETRARLA